MTTTAPQHTPAQQPSALPPLSAKVPETIGLFWVIKILTTGNGEAASDWMVSANPVLALSVAVVGCVTAIWLQFHVQRYRAVVYWLAVAMVAVFGTLVADITSFVVGIPLSVGSLIWAVLLATTLYVWHRSEGTLSIHSITTRRRELFYWATVMATFILGTALGDFLADSLHLGYLLAGVFFAALIVIPFVARRWFGLNGVAAFWTAYVLTRPLGASFADWFGKPVAEGGVGLGMGPVTVVATAIIIALVAYLAVTRKDIQRPATATVISLNP